MKVEKSEGQKSDSRKVKGWNVEWGRYKDLMVEK